ncbi:hypothetical protein CU097_001109 [Rhizopus azygosporus]|uniref:SMP-LTD domain-containing protein n=1 Tax=Rhizopus azygosporus TaxID=86630 RepID=A0A367J672_RHIAZ|nr:hypothetical protein CU097_001109 [Rhizopus azygosporus]
MNYWLQLLGTYFIGGLTFTPVLLFLLYHLLPKHNTVQKPDHKEHRTSHSNSNVIKKGWIQLSKMHKREACLSDIKRKKQTVYAELRKCGALFIFEKSDLQEQQDENACRLIIPVHDYNVSMHLFHNDKDTFGRSTFLRLASNKKEEYYITCERAVDKEDWYLGLIAAASVINDQETVEMMDSMHFDPAAMRSLIQSIQQDTEYRQVQWLNAILGRLFLGMYKTQAMQEYVQEKISSKIKKVKLPSFLGDIQVQSVDLGQSVPFVVQPKLLSLTPEGDLLVEATLNYVGAFQVVIQLDCSYSLIHVPLILSVTLKQLTGRFLFKVKPPPSNRCWIGFYEMPKTEWEITPVVSDKWVKLSMVTSMLESKIREFMVETIVLPNMDEFPFFPSHGSLGGIFGERIPRPSETTKEEKKEEEDLLMDMLGNRPAQPAELPKADQRITYDDILLLPKPPTRRSESVGLLEPLSSKSSMSNHRAKSTPELRKRISDNSTPQPTTEKSTIVYKQRTYSYNSDNDEDCSVNSSHITASDSSSSRSSHSSRSSSKSNDSSTSVSSTSIQPLSPEAGLNFINFQETYLGKEVDIKSIHPLDKPPQYYHPSNSSDSVSIGSSKSTIKYNKLINNMNNKKQAFCNMAGNLFTKKSKFIIKSKITKEMREERNRELQEIHNKKMMGLFLTSPTE